MPTQTNTVTIAQALVILKSGLLVQDTAVAIAAALPNADLVARVSSFTVSAPAVLTATQILALAGLGVSLHAANGALTLNSAATVTAAQLTALEAMPGFTLGNASSLTLSDTTAHVTALLAAHSTWFAQLAGVTVHLDGTSIGAYPATQLNGLALHGKALSFIASPGQTVLNVAAAAHDLGSNAANLDALAARTPVSFTLTNDGATVVAADAAGLASLHGFSPAAHTLTVSDTAANITAYAGVIFGQGFTSIKVLSGTFAGTAAILTDPTLHIQPGAHAQLAASATLSGQAATAMVGLPGFSLATGAQLSVTDNAANLATTAPSWLAFASAASLSTDAVVPATVATGLALVASRLGQGFSLGGHSLIVSDTLSNLLALPGQTAALTTGLALSGNALASVAQVVAFAALPHVALAGFSIAVSDTAANLLTLSGTALADAASRALSADATVSAASFAALRALPQFSLAGHVLTVADTAASLLALTGSLSLAGATSLSANAQVSAAQLSALAGLPGFSLGGHALAVTDSAQALLALPPATLGMAASVTLSADATVTAAQATTLAGEPAFSTGGHHLTIADTATNLAALAPAVAALAASETLISSTILSAAAATALVAAPGFSIAQGATLTVSDTLPNLLALPAHTASLAAALVLNASAIASAAQAAAFAALPHAALGGFSINVVDTAANLLAMSGAALADTASQALSADATVTAASFAALRGLPQFALGGHALTISDTAPDLVALTGNLSLAGAIVLSGNAQVSAAQLAALASLPVFSLASHVLSLTDNAAALLALPSAALSLAGSVTLAADATVSAMQAITLAAEPVFSSGGHHLTIADTAANLAALAPSVAALATAETLTAPATLSAAAATALVATPGFNIAPGASLTVADTLAALLALPTLTVSFAGTLVLSANATASAAQVAAFAALAHSALGGFTISVVDTAANLLAMSGGALADTASQALSADATVTAANFNALRALPQFGLGGHVLTIADTASALAALTGSLSLAGATMLSADAQVSTAQLSALSVLPAFSLAGHVLSVSGTAPALLALSPAASGLAGSVTLSADATVSAAQAATLAAEPGFSAGGHHLTIADTAANLAALAPSVAGLATAETLTASATLNAAAAAALVAAPGFTVAQGASLTVADTIGALLALPALAANLAASLVLTAGASASAAQVTAFAALRHVSLGGFTISVVDTAANLLGLSGAALADTGLAALSADASVSAAQIAALEALPGFSTNGHAVSVVDTAANLLASPVAALALAGSVTLSADATVTAAQAITLMAEPGFSAGAHHLTIADTAANLLALPHAAQLAAGTLALASSQSVSAAQLTQLAQLGIKFSEDDHIVTCTDSAPNLAALSPSALALAAAEVLATPAIVSAAMAASLAALPNLSLGSGATLTVQDNVANLIALGSGVPAITNAVQLASGSAVTITAGQAHALSVIPHFAVGSASITVADTVTDFSSLANLGWQSVAVTTQVVDTAANLAASWFNPLVQLAASATLSGNGQVNAAAAAQIAGIPHFSSGAYQLTVTDTAAAIAAHAAAVVGAATQAVVTDSGPVSTTVADQLATVSAAGKLSFLGGDQLQVQDSYAALINPANASGLALAARLGVADTAANLVVAAAHDWGALNPSYTLTQGGVISAIQAETLAGLGSHFAAAGYVLRVTDTAVAVVGAATALASLGITASVLDIAANINAQISALQGLGSELSSVRVTDQTAVTASVAAGLAGLAGKLHGPALHVADTAALVDASLAGLSTLGWHVAIAVTDSAANVDSVAGDLATLHSALTVTLTDIGAVTAAIAAGLAPLATNLAAGTSLSVTDTGMAVAANVAGLWSLSNDIGTVTLSDGAAQTAAVAAALVPLDAHLAIGFMLTATGTGASITNYEAGLSQLAADGRLAGVVVANTSVADATGNAAALNLLAAHVTVSDTAADVDASLAGLAALSGLTAIALTDSGTPSLAMSVATLSADAPVLAMITTSYTITINDTAADIAADLASGASSVIAAHRAQIGAITASDGQPVILTETQVLAAGIDDGASSALANFTGTLHVTGVDLAHLSQVLALPVQPASVTVSDTSADLSADLAQGSGSLLVVNASQVTHIFSSDGAPIHLTASQVLAAGVDDSAGSAIGKLSGAALVVGDAAISQLAALAHLSVAPAYLEVYDVAANISADLASGSPALVASLSGINRIVVSDGLPIMLTEAQVLAAGIDDGLGSVLSKIPGVQLEVSGVVAADLAEMFHLGVAPTSVSINDSAAHLISSLSTVLADIGKISAITVTGTPTLTAAEALGAQVDDGAGSLIDRLAGHMFNVSGAAVSQLTPLVSLPDAPGAIAVSDSSGNIVADLTSGSSSLAADLASINLITVTHGKLCLTDAQAEMILHTPALDAVFAKLASTAIVSVSGAPVADLAGLAGTGWPHLTVTVADTVSAIAADLNSGSSSLLANAAMLGSVTLDGSGTVDAATLTQMAGLPVFATGGYALGVSDGAAAIAGLGAAAIGFTASVHVADTDSNVTGELDALQGKFAGALSITLTNATPSITIGAEQYGFDTTTVDAITNQGVVTVTGTAAQLAQFAGRLGTDAVVGAVHVTDNAMDVVTNLASLQLAGPKLSVTLTDASLSASMIVPLLGIAGLNSAAIPVVDTGSQIAAVVETGDFNAIAYLNANGATLSGTSTITATDAAALESLTNFGKAGHQLQVWDTVAHLTSPAYAAALANTAVDGVYLKTPSGSVVTTAAAASTLFGIAGFSTHNPGIGANILNVSDSAAHIDATLVALTNNRGSIGSITVNAPATITDQVLGHLQGLSAVTGSAIVVRDTAAIIADNAVVQGTGQTIVPSAWTLSGSGTVTEAQAAMLGHLANFSTGAYTITLSLGGDLPISASDANALGSIAGALNLGGHSLIVSGTVAQLSTLTPAALGLVTPALADSFANIAALQATSALLAGTVEVTGSDPLTAASVSTFLGLVHTGAGQGIAAANLSFDGMHVVSDTVAHLRGLMSGAGWTGNTGTHADFTLVARDSAANLISATNTGLLSGLSQTGLAADTTIAAASATTLSNLAGTIHFTHDHMITVQDSAANLLNPANTAGLGMADTVHLSGSATVDAADAESLLGISHFSLTTPLTISDSSANLLDGTLPNAISASGYAPEFTVQLAGPETLDADTAQTLVSLPGFQDTTNITIADSSSYLLNTANMTAEHMAATVTLAGDETMSANTVLRLSHVPHFDPGASHLVLAGNDFADAATLKAIADDGTAFQSNGHAITLTQDALDLTSGEYTALQSDIIHTNGHAIGITPTVSSVSDASDMLNVTAVGLAGGTVHVYAQDGTQLSSTIATNAGFTVSVADTAPGHSFAITETAGSVEGAPLVVLDAASMETAAASAGSLFATTGQIQIDAGKFVNLYVAGAVPTLTQPALVYDPVAHTVSLDLPGGAPVTLITLGGSTHPGSLDVSEILIKHHG